jgi:hypothetical protein
MDRNVIERYRLSLFGRMVMGVAHEVDNHLSVVLGFSELIQLAAGKEQKVRDGAPQGRRSGRSSSIFRGTSVRTLPPRNRSCPTR